MDYIKIAKINEFENDNIRSFSVMGKKVGIIKRTDGSFYAIEIGCKHQGADLSVGEISGTIATCYRHGWKYDLESGKCLTNVSPDLKKYQLRIENEEILISITPIEENEWFDEGI